MIFEVLFSLILSFSHLTSQTCASQLNLFRSRYSKTKVSVQDFLSEFYVLPFTIDLKFAPLKYDPKPNSPQEFKIVTS